MYVMVKRAHVIDATVTFVFIVTATTEIYTLSLHDALPIFRIDTLPIVCFHASKSWRLFYGSFFFSSRRRHTISLCDWSSDVCSSDLDASRERARERARCFRPRSDAEKAQAAGRWRQSRARGRSEERRVGKECRSPRLGGFLMVSSYYPAECHADNFDFEGISALKHAI